MRYVKKVLGSVPMIWCLGILSGGPLAVLRDNWIESTPPKNLLCYVNDFKRRLYEAGKMAKEQLVFFTKAY